MSITGETLSPQKLGKLNLSWDLNSDLLDPKLCAMYHPPWPLTPVYYILECGKFQMGVSLFYAALKQGFSTQAYY